MGVQSPSLPEQVAAELERIRAENQTLYAVINTVSSSLDLDRVLGGVVQIATEATGCHACFVYFLEGERLVLRAASSLYARFVGRLSMGLEEGLTGWVARNKTPEFIRDSALDDPRMKYMPELEEERFQSMVAVPVLARSGDVIGVIVLHTAAPREFEPDVLNFLVHTASLVAGAIENAQLFGETRRRVEALSGLTDLLQRMAAAPSADALYAAVTDGVRALLDVPACQVYRLEPDAGELDLAASDPPDLDAPRPQVPRTGLLLELLRQGGAGNGRRRSGGRLARALWPADDERELLVTPLAVGDEALGILCAIDGPERTFSEEDVGLFTAVAHQASVGLKKAELIERLTAENTVKDMFDALEAGALDVAQSKAGAAGCDLERWHVYVNAEPAPRRQAGAPPWPVAAERLETGLRGLYPHAVIDARHERVRALVPLPSATGLERVRDIQRACAGLGTAEGAAVGVSGARRGAAEGRQGMREAADATRIGRALLGEGGALAYDDLGAYRYLVHLELDDAPRDRYWSAVELLLEYDRRRQTHLVETLEQYLMDRRSIGATARALYIHPNTLRQRLHRIEKLSGLDIASEDLLSLELAVKLVRLHGGS